MSGSREDSGEGRMVRKALRAVKAAGFVPVCVDDGGDELVKGAGKVMLEREVMDAVFAVDDATVLFRKFDRSGAVLAKAWFRVILGNARDGSEAIADNSVTPGFAEALDAVVFEGG